MKLIKSAVKYAALAIPAFVVMTALKFMHRG